MDYVVPCDTMGASSPGGSPPEPLLQVRDLSVELVSKPNATLPIVAGASFDVPRGRIVGLFGESGCGKTTLASALPGLLPRGRYRITGSVKLEGRELISLSGRELESVRGAGIGFVFQDPLLSLNPVLRVRTQIAEAVRAHSGNGGSVEEACAVAGATFPLDAYPHQLSGGERQRVAIALALACRPPLVIADEPFTALDPGRASALAAVFRALREERGASFLLIDHSPAALSRAADEAMVMYAGRIVERGPARDVLNRPLHPYTVGLLACLPRPGCRNASAPIPGESPGLLQRPAGCGFEPRCGARCARCAEEAPGEYSPEEGRTVRCFRYA